MVAGRPKEYDRLEIGRQMVAWATNNPKALTVPMFATSVDLNSSILRAWCNQDEEFRSLYMKAKELIGVNRFNSVDTRIDNSLYKGTLHHYDYDVRDDIREEKTFERDLGTSSTDVEPNKDAINQGHENMQLKHELERTRLEIQQLKEQLDANKS